MNARVSIIIPCYNQARFVQQAVASCFAQTFSNFQVIVLDDGSTDDPRAALQEFLNRPNLKILRQENRGLANARNAAIAASDGAYLKLLDADDWLAPTVIAKQAALLDAHPALGFVFCDRVRVNARGETLDAGTVGAQIASWQSDLFSRLLLGGFFPPVSVMLTRAAFARVGNFDQTLSPCEDLDLWLRILAHGYHAQFLAEPLVSYRLHDAGLSQDHARMEQQYRAVLQKTVAQFPERVAAALSEIAAQFHRVNGDHSALSARESDQRESLAQLARDKIILQNAADTREAYLRVLENNFVFRAMVKMGLVPRRAEIENRKSKI